MSGAESPQPRQQSQAAPVDERDCLQAGKSAGLTCLPARHHGWRSADPPLVAQKESRICLSLADMLTLCLVGSRQATKRAFARLSPRVCALRTTNTIANSMDVGPTYRGELSHRGAVDPAVVQPGSGLYDVPDQLKLSSTSRLFDVLSHFAPATIANLHLDTPLDAISRCMRQKQQACIREAPSGQAW